jgi:hypothetical protein
VTGEQEREHAGIAPLHSIILHSGLDFG